jgi:multicomponent Na+:H+ antiporter subunit G
MALVTYAIVALLAGGAFFGFVAALGIIRLPGFFARTHAASKGETLSLALTLAGAALAIGEALPTVKTLLLLLFALLTNPTAAHAISRAAYEEDVEPWTVEGSTDEGAER